MVFTSFNTSNGTFCGKRPENSHHIYQAINDMSSMQTFFGNVNLFCQKGFALRTGLTRKEWPIVLYESPVARNL